MVLFTDALNTFKGSESLLTSIAGFTYEDIIQTKSSYKSALLDAGIGFDGRINYNICFDAKFNTTNVFGDVFFKVNGLFDRIAEYEVNILNKNNTTVDPDDEFSLYITTEWNVDVTNPTVLSVEGELAEKYTGLLSSGVYDPLFACTERSTHFNSWCNNSPNIDGSICIGEYLSEYSPAGESIFNEPRTGAMPAPQLNQYYFKTSPNTWASMCLKGTQGGNEVTACAALLPVDCTTKEEIPFTPLAQTSKLSALSIQNNKKTEVQNLLNILTLGATGPLMENLSNSNTTSDIKNSLLTQALSTPQDLSGLLALLNTQDKLSLPDIMTNPVSSLKGLINNDLLALSALLSIAKPTAG